MVKELESRYNGPPLSFLATLSADSCYTRILRFVIMVVVQVEVVVHKRHYYFYHFNCTPFNLRSAEDNPQYMKRKDESVVIRVPLFSFSTLNRKGYRVFPKLNRVYH